MPSVKGLTHHCPDTISRYLKKFRLSHSGSGEGALARRPESLREGKVTRTLRRILKERLWRSVIQGGRAEEEEQVGWAKIGMEKRDATGRTDKDRATHTHRT